MAIQRLSVAQIEAQMDQLAQSPQDLGVLEYIILRLPDEQRATPQAAEVSPDSGLEGDRWARPNSPNPGAQISVMNSRFLRIIAGDDARMPLAGDNLLVDLDLSEENLSAGTQLQIGTATFEVTMSHIPDAKNSNAGTAKMHLMWSTKRPINLNDSADCLYAQFKPERFRLGTLSAN